MTASSSAQRGLPSTDRVLGLAPVAALITRHGRALVAAAVRGELAQRRTRMGDGANEDVDDSAIAAAVALRIEAALAPSLRPVFNLTGTVLHTNLGRAPLPREAIEEIARIAGGAASLEYDLDDGARGERDAHVESWLCRLTGAEAASVVNNNAAAVLLVLNTLAAKKEVAVSRGELIEIGGAFRLPEIMARAGAKLREVGTTNRTHLADFEAALSPRLAAIMKVHPSNYAIEGFTASVPEASLAALAQAHNMPFIVDLGSGTLVDLERFGLPHEPTAAETIAAGADLVTFSGDKLLGGPQAGLIVGKRELIKRIRKNPMKRALRVGKLTLAALGAVLRLYADPERLAARLPALRLLARPKDDIAAQAARVAPALVDALGARARVDIVDCASEIGSGALPTRTLPSVALALAPAGPRRGAGRALAGLAAAFRALPIPVIGRVHDGRLLLDLRCLEDETGFVGQLAQLDLGPP